MGGGDFHILNPSSNQSGTVQQHTSKGFFHLSLSVPWRTQSQLTKDQLSKLGDPKGQEGASEPFADVLSGFVTATISPNVLQETKVHRIDQLARNSYNSSSTSDTLFIRFKFNKLILFAKKKEKKTKRADILGWNRSRRIERGGGRGDPRLCIDPK